MVKERWRVSRKRYHGIPSGLMRNERNESLMRFLRVIPLIPPIFIAVIVITTSCGKSIYPAASSSATSSGTSTSTSSGSATATATPTATATAALQSLALVTNYLDGKLSVFAREPESGSLSLQGTVAAGPANGPKGVAVASDNRAAYVANNADGNIYQYALAPSAGALIPMNPAAVPDAANGGTEMLAIGRDGKYLFATNSRNATITSYQIDQSTAALAPVASYTLPGDSAPFGIADDPASDYIYVSDSRTGLIYSFQIDGSGALRKVGDAVYSLGSSPGHPGAMAIGSGDKSLYTVDTVTGAISKFSIAHGRLSFVRAVSPLATSGTALDIAVTNDLLIEPAASGIAVSSTRGAADLQVASGGQVNSPVAVVADPDERYLYTTNNGNGTVGVFAIGSGCAQAACFKEAIPSENPPNPASGPFWIALTH